MVHVIVIVSTCGIRNKELLKILVNVAQIFLWGLRMHFYVIQFMEKSISKPIDERSNLD